MRTLLVAAALVLVLVSPAWAQPGSHLLVVVGLGGDSDNAERFHRWASAIVDAARDRYGLPADDVIYLGEHPARDPKRCSGRSTREAVDQAAGLLAARARPGDRVFIVLIGHGASATGAARFNLPGPDLTAAEFSKLLDRFAAQSVIFVNTASASGGFVAALSAKNRVIITATLNEGERNQARFGEYFADGLSSLDADADKDGRVSMLEAFTWARGRVAESYERDGQLLTEHAVLDDNGDGKGSDTPGQPGADGSLARTVFLAAAPSGDGALANAADPELRALAVKRRALEGQIAALQAVKEKTDAAAYARDLEQFLLELARTNRAIRERQKK